MDPDECLRLCLDLCKDLMKAGGCSFVYSFRAMHRVFCESGFERGSFDLMMLVARGYLVMSEDERISERFYLEGTDEVCERFIDLGEWIEGGGFLPKLWKKS